MEEMRKRGPEIRPTFFFPYGPETQVKMYLGLLVDCDYNAFWIVPCASKTSKQYELDGSHNYRKFTDYQEATQAYNEACVLLRNLSK